MNTLPKRLKVNCYPWCKTFWFCNNGSLIRAYNLVVHGECKSMRPTNSQKWRKKELAIKLLQQMKQNSERYFDRRLDKTTSPWFHLLRSIPSQLVQIFRIEFIFGDYKHTFFEPWKYASLCPSCFRRDLTFSFRLSNMCRQDMTWLKEAVGGKLALFSMSNKQSKPLIVYFYEQENGINEFCLFLRSGDFFQ